MKLNVYTRLGVDTLIASLKTLLTAHQNNLSAHGLTTVRDNITANTASIATLSSTSLFGQRGAVMVADDFSEADGTAIVGKAPDTGTAWTSLLGAPTVQGGNAAVTSGAGQAVVLSSAVHDVVVRVVGRAANAADTFGVCLLKSDGGTRYYYASRTGAGEVRVQWWDGAALQLLTTANAAMPSPIRDEVLTVIRSKGRMVVRLDGVQVLDLTVTDYSANTTHSAGINLVNGGKVNEIKLWPVEVI